MLRRSICPPKFLPMQPPATCFSFPSCSPLQFSLISRPLRSHSFVVTLETFPAVGFQFSFNRHHGVLMLSLPNSALVSRSLPSLRHFRLAYRSRFRFRSPTFPTTACFGFLEKSALHVLTLSFSQFLVHYHCHASGSRQHHFLPGTMVVPTLPASWPEPPTAHEYQRWRSGASGLQRSVFSPVVVSGVLTFSLWRPINCID